MKAEIQLAQLVKKFRAGRSQQEIAEKFKVSRQLVYLWEHGLSKPRPEHLDAMGIKTEYSLRKEV